MSKCITASQNDQAYWLHNFESILHKAKPWTYCFLCVLAWVNVSFKIYFWKYVKVESTASKWMNEWIAWSLCQYHYLDTRCLFERQRDVRNEGTFCFLYKWWWIIFSLISEKLLDLKGAKESLCFLVNTISSNTLPLISTQYNFKVSIQTNPILLMPPASLPF